MEKKNLDWSSLGFGYIQTDKRYVSNYKNGSWDEGTLTSDATITISECAGVLQYAQTVFEGMKAYTCLLYTSLCSSLGAASSCNSDDCCSGFGKGYTKALS